MFYFKISKPYSIYLLTNFVLKVFYWHLHENFSNVLCILIIKKRLQYNNNIAGGKKKTRKAFLVKS